MTDVVIVEAVRTPVGRRGGGLSTVHPADLLGAVADGRWSSAPASTRPRSARSSAAASARSASRRFNIARTAWLAAGLPLSVRRHHGRHPVRVVASRPPTSPPSLVGSGVVDVAVGLRRRGDEPGADRVSSRARRSASASRSRRPYFGQLRDDVAVRGRRAHRREVGHHPRRHRRASASRRQQRAARAWAEDRFAGQIVAIDAPDLDEDGKPTGTTHRVARDEGLRETTLEKLADAQAGRPRGRRAHRRLLVADLRRRGGRAAHDRGEGRRSSASRPKARIVDTCLVGVDPVLMLTGPIDATQRLLERTGLTIDDIDIVRDQRGVRLGRAGLGQGARRRTWRRSTRTAAPSPSATRSAAPARSCMTKALHELERTGGRYGLVIDVLRRRARHRHHHRAAVAPELASTINVDVSTTSKSDPCS